VRQSRRFGRVSTTSGPLRLTDIVKGNRAALWRLSRRAPCASGRRTPVPKTRGFRNPKQGYVLAKKRCSETTGLRNSCSVGSTKNPAPRGSKGGPIRSQHVRIVPWGDPIIHSGGDNSRICDLRNRANFRRASDRPRTVQDCVWAASRCGQNGICL
jgi:hypothetical protein